MEDQTLSELFLDELKDTYHAEKQILKALPKMIKKASSPDLSKALSNHLKETEGQVKRIEEIFSILDLKPKAIKCEAMEGILKEGDELVKNKAKNPTLDAAIISAAQKVEHYEIASYGTLRSFAKHLDLEDRIIELLQETLDEEGAADKKLTSIGDGSYITKGVNKKAAEEDEEETQKKPAKKKKK